MRAIALIALLCACVASTSGYRCSGVRTSRIVASPILPVLAAAPELQSSLATDKKPVIANYLFLFVGLPIASLLLPLLLERITDGSATSLERQYSIIELLLSKRLYIYSTAICTVDLISRTSYNERALDTGGFAQRLLRLNNDIFGTNVTVDFGDTVADTADSSAVSLSELAEVAAAAPEDEKAMESAYRLIGSQVRGGAEAALIPTLLAASLLLSFASLLMSRGGTEGIGSIAGAAAGGAAAVTLFSNLAVCFLFSKLQIKTALRSLSGDGNISGIDAVSAAAAAVLSAVCISSVPGSQIFPLFNIVNVFIAATVARLFLVEQLRYIIMSLLAMALYDYFFVLGSSAFFTDNGQSIMEAVAVAKSGIVTGGAVTSSAVDSGNVFSNAISYLQSCWRPGLLEVAVGGRVTDVLGLADVIFPSMLSAYCMREGSARLYASSIAGLAAGCLACEIFQTGAGQPALLYMVPSMLLALALEKGYSKLVSRGDLDSSV